MFFDNRGTAGCVDRRAVRAMHIFTPDEPENPEWNIVVSRDRLEAGETLADYLDKQLTEMPKALPRFRLLSNEEIAVNEVPARQLPASLYHLARYEVSNCVP